MKIHHYSPLPVAALLLVAALAAPNLRADDQPNVTTIKFSDPSQPGTLKISLATGDVKVTGTNTGEVTLTTDLAPESAAPRADGLRVISESTTFSLTEKDNVITLDAGQEMNFGGRDSTFEITVPKSTNVVIRTSFGGEVHVGDLTGDIEIKSLHGEVTLTNVNAGAIVETMNGEITADIRNVSAGKPLSFTSMNGEISLQVPVDAKANVRLRTQNGAILTDFDDKILVTKTEAIPGSRKHGTYVIGLDSKGSDSREIREAVREAVRAGVDAAREAAIVIREAAQAAREAAHEARNETAHDDSSVAPLPPLPPLPPMTGGKLVSGALNGGGSEIYAAAMNGDITLRKAK